MSAKLTVYFLTYNSGEKYLHQIIERIRPIADEILFIDSNSTDNTRQIAESYGARVLVRPFDDFSSQRAFAWANAAHDYVLGLDDDEVPTVALCERLKKMKEEGFAHDAYVIRRNNIVLGKQVTCYYPLMNPDYVIRLLNKKFVKPGERKVHPTPYGYRSIEQIETGELTHYTFENRTELNNKIRSYGKVAAREVIEAKEKFILLRYLAMPFLVWTKWYLVKGGWKDGQVGWQLGRYAFMTVHTKYKNALKLAGF
ncbi:MAG: glycosyltransferase family 2 protein [Mucilaginibacter polytrichastri]|nr:glycosyltransferase family 2 protein [Mucilaginibacter polytrichastri]